jgi:hypothetical protein
MGIRRPTLLSDSGEARERIKPWHIHSSGKSMQYIKEGMQGFFEDLIFWKIVLPNIFSPSAMLVGGRRSQGNLHRAKNQARVAEVNGS